MTVVIVVEFVSLNDLTNTVERVSNLYADYTQIVLINDCVSQITLLKEL